MKGISYRKLVKLLTKNKTGIYVDSSRAKGAIACSSEMVWMEVSVPIPCHSTE